MARTVVLCSLIGVGWGVGKDTYAEVSPSGGSTLVMCKKTATYEIFSQLLVFTVTPSSKSFNKKKTRMKEIKDA